MAEPSKRTKALEAAWKKLTKDLKSDPAPELPWKLNQKDKTAEAAINRLIKQAPAGSAKRQELIELKSSYFAKLKAWQIKDEQKTKNWYAARDAYKASVKLDTLSERQQDNKDTGVSDQKLDSEIETLQQTVDAAPKTDGTDSRPPSSYINPNAPGNQTALPKETPKPTGTLTTGDGGKGGTPTPALTDAEQRAQALAAAAANPDFSLPETLFNNIGELTQLLNDYVKSDETGGQWTLDTFRQKFRDTNWYKNNSAEIKARYVQLYNYRDQLKGGQDVRNTDYAKQISTLERQIADRARAMGSGIASDPAALRRAAENFYITNVGIDDAMATDLIASAIRPIGSTIAGTPTSGYSGQALKDYQAIQGIARANGFRVKDVVPGGETEEQVLQGIATGRIDANRLAQDARKLAAQGQPQYVRDLLGQGYNLDQIYAPYRQTMANILEINEDEIDLNDQTLRSAITDKGDMNIYDFKKTLKADSRWQYTENAKQEVSDVALQVLRDFGFQG